MDVLGLQPPLIPRSRGTYLISFGHSTKRQPTPFPSVSVLFLLPFLCLVLLAETLVDVDAGEEEGKGEYDEPVKLELVRVQLRAYDRNQNVARQVGVFLYHVIKVLQHTRN